MELINIFSFSLDRFSCLKYAKSVLLNVIVVYKYTDRHTLLCAYSSGRAATTASSRRPPCGGYTNDHYLGSVSPEVKVLQHSRRTYARDFLYIPCVRVNTLVCYCNIRIYGSQNSFYLRGLNLSATVLPLLLLLLYSRNSSVRNVVF